jgi:hypothetical protein
MVVAIGQWADSLPVEDSRRRNFIKIESEPRMPTKKREEHLTYVDEDGRVMFEVVKIVRIGGA